MIMFTVVLVWIDIDMTGSFTLIYHTDTQACTHTYTVYMWYTHSMSKTNHRIFHSRGHSKTHIHMFVWACTPMKHNRRNCKIFWIKIHFSKWLNGERRTPERPNDWVVRRMNEWVCKEEVFWHLVACSCRCCFSLYSLTPSPCHSFQIYAKDEEKTDTQEFEYFWHFF